MCVTARESEGENRGASDGRGGEGEEGKGESQMVLLSLPHPAIQRGWGGSYRRRVAEDKESGRVEERKGIREWRE